ncbi:hypothetical protein [Streptomyces zhihengii]|uniref:Uncharacterized protein n=1 Tax=Streptomyces zhihengii TaxID=1818004 RepID=A0ABS2V2D2_9ACTN|nr:hypothetical protein [Streptomyces zhihengii]MBM9623890.1 hypothetical protein [Streptomyces zhihengii]
MTKVMSGGRDECALTLNPRGSRSDGEVSDEQGFNEPSAVCHIAAAPFRVVHVSTDGMPSTAELTQID